MVPTLKNMNSQSCSLDLFKVDSGIFENSEWLSRYIVSIVTPQSLSCDFDKEVHCKSLLILIWFAFAVLFFDFLDIFNYVSLLCVVLFSTVCNHLNRWAFQNLILSLINWPFSNTLCLICAMMWEFCLLIILPCVAIHNSNRGLVMLKTLLSFFVCVYLLVLHCTEWFPRETSADWSSFRALWMLQHNHCCLSTQLSPQHQRIWASAISISKGILADLCRINLPKNYSKFT